VNVEEDTEVLVHSGAGSGYVKNEDIETDASKNAQPPFHTDTSSERKRKSSAASDAFTTRPKQTRTTEPNNQ